MDETKQQLAELIGRAVARRWLQRPDAQETRAPPPEPGPILEAVTQESQTRPKTKNPSSSATDRS